MGEKWRCFTFLIGLRKHSHSFPYRKLFQKVNHLNSVKRVWHVIHLTLQFFFTTLKKRREDKKGSIPLRKHKVVTCWAATEWKSLAMWFLSFVVHQITVPGTLPATAMAESTLHLFASSPVTLKALDDHIYSSFQANVTWKKRRGLSQAKEMYTTPWHVESLCTWTHSYTPLEWELMLLMFVPKTTLNNFTFVFDEKWPRRLRVLHSSAEWGRCEAEQEHAAPATWSVLKQK